MNAKYRMKSFLATLGCILSLAGAADGQAARTGDQRQTPPELWQLEKQRLELFVNGSRITGNVDSSAFGGNLRYALRMNQRNSLFAEASAAYSAYNNATQIENSRASALYAYALHTRLNFYLWSAVGQNKFLNIHYRTTQGTGFCFHGFAPGVFSPIMLSVGVAPEYALYYGGEQQRKFRANGRLVFRLPVAGFLTLGNDFIYFASFHDFTDYRIYNESFADFAIVQDKLSYRITLTDEYENKPFAGVKKNDFTLAQGLVFNFGK